MKTIIMARLLVASLAISLAACASPPLEDKLGESHGGIVGPNPREIVFIHGMFVTPKCWQDWLPRFRQAGFQVSAPAWPLHDGPVEELRQPERHAALGKLELSQVLDSYRAILRAKPVKPILVGHSMGGLIAQILLSEGLGQAAVAIDPAPPTGVIVLSWSFLKSNWGAVDPFASIDRPIELDLGAFSYAFVNKQEESLRKRIHDEFYMPESRRVGKGPTTDVGKIDTTKARGPLLIIAGGDDNIVPASLNYKNFGIYRETPGYTEFKLFEGRDHWTLAGSGWESVADAVAAWIGRRFQP